MRDLGADDGGLGTAHHHRRAARNERHDEDADGRDQRRHCTLAAADGWKKLTLPWSEFKLADDSRDENGLDASELKQILVADATSLFAGAPGDDAVLRVDEVRFLLR